MLTRDYQGNIWELGIEGKTSTPISAYGSVDLDELMRVARRVSSMPTYGDLVHYIDKFKWKPISEYNNKDYDWVLVKYFDGDYECVPCVAERRKDGKWHSIDDKEIPFEVRYFFDMLELGEADDRR